MRKHGSQTFTIFFQLNSLDLRSLKIQLRGYYIFYSMNIVPDPPISKTEVYCTYCIRESLIVIASYGCSHSCLQKNSNNTKFVNNLMLVYWYIYGNKSKNPVNRNMKSFLKEKEGVELNNFTNIANTVSQHTSHTFCFVSMNIYIFSFPFYFFRQSQRSNRAEWREIGGEMQQRGRRKGPKKVHIRNDNVVNMNMSVR